MYSFSTKRIHSKRIIIPANGSKIPLLILKPLSKEAIKKFNEMFAYAKEHFFATQDS